MGLSLDIYRAGYNSPNNVLAGYKKVTVVNVEGPVEPTEDAPAVVLTGNAYMNPIIRPDMGWFHERNLYLQVPATESGAHGGAYAATSDSRFGRALKEFGSNQHFAVPIHDYSFTLEAQ